MSTKANVYVHDKHHSERKAESASITSVAREKVSTFTLSTSLLHLHLLVLHNHFMIRYLSSTCLFLFLSPSLSIAIKRPSLLTFFFPCWLFYLLTPPPPQKKKKKKNKKKQKTLTHTHSHPFIFFIAPTRRSHPPPTHTHTRPHPFPDTHDILYCIHN